MGVDKCTGNLNKSTGEGEDFQGNKKGLAGGSTGTASDNSDGLFLE